MSFRKLPARQGRFLRRCRRQAMRSTGRLPPVHLLLLLPKQEAQWSLSKGRRLPSEWQWIVFSRARTLPDLWQKRRQDSAVFRPEPRLWQALPVPQEMPLIRQHPPPKALERAPTGWAITTALTDSETMRGQQARKWMPHPVKLSTSVKPSRRWLLP